MPDPVKIGAQLERLLLQISDLKESIRRIEPDKERRGSKPTTLRKFVKESGYLLSELKQLREKISPVYFGSIGISLGRSDGIAKFFAFSFVNQRMRPMLDLPRQPFYGSGVYAIYYCGLKEKAYLPLSGTETPIYVGKSTPENPVAETTEEQGQSLFKRLKEHAKNIEKTELELMDFEYRAAPIQTGMQGAVEEFMIRFFNPIWNKETNVCFGIGKHGDSARTRGNKRSPWDTMHPGRAWAEETVEDQRARSDIELKIADHFKTFPPIGDKEALFKELALG